MGKCSKTDTGGRVNVDSGNGVPIALIRHILPANCCKL